MESEDSIPLGDPADAIEAGIPPETHSSAVGILEFLPNDADEDRLVVLLEACLEHSDIE